MQGREVLTLRVCARTMSFMIDHDDPDYIWQLVWPTQQTVTMPSANQRIRTIVNNFYILSFRRRCRLFHCEAPLHGVQSCHEHARKSNETFNALHLLWSNLSNCTSTISLTFYMTADCHRHLTEENKKSVSIAPKGEQMSSLFIPANCWRTCNDKQIITNFLRPHLSDDGPNANTKFT